MHTRNSSRRVGSMHSFTCRQNLGPVGVGVGGGGRSASAGTPSFMYAANASLCAGSVPQRESGTSRTMMSPAAHAMRFASISRVTSWSGQRMHPAALARLLLGPRHVCKRGARRCCTLMHHYRAVCTTIELHAHAHVHVHAHVCIAVLRKCSGAL
eukprot:scaffold115737_cov66-Phaeocystis_antarctica.AAC.2